jgi:hypothetical protein
MLTVVVAISVFAFAGLATADKPVCLDADGDEVACEKKGPPGDAESADGTGTESADGTGVESADGTGIESADGTGIESADGTGTESEADPEGG